MIQARGSEVQLVQKTLESANMKLAAEATDGVGVSDRPMLRLWWPGSPMSGRWPPWLRGDCDDKQDALEQALEGMVGTHHRFILREQLKHIDEMDARIDRLDDDRG